MRDEKANPAIEVQDIFRQFAPAYLQSHRLPLQHLKVASAISFCRTDRLGAQIGVTAVLHTWGQNLMDHPHIHCIVTGGGLSFDRLRWINSRKKFFIPVKVLSKKFRGKFLYYLKQHYAAGLLGFHGKIAALANEEAFKALLNQLYEKDWVVYCKRPFKSPHHVMEYLGRYTHRVAISNNRIVKIEQGKVTFRWRDYRDKGKEKLMTIEGHEFIRRFLMHVLPRRFVKIRHFGILSNRNRQSKLLKCKKLTGVNLSSIPKKLTTAELLLKLTDRDVTLCPCCQKGHMKRQALLPLMALP